MIVRYHLDGTVTKEDSDSEFALAEIGPDHWQSCPFAPEDMPTASLVHDEGLHLDLDPEVLEQDEHEDTEESEEIEEESDEQPPARRGEASRRRTKEPGTAT